MKAALTVAIIACTSCALALPVAQSTRGALFFAEQRAMRVGYIGWPPRGCNTDTDCKHVNGSYCMNDKTKTAPFFCHDPPVYLKSGLDKPVGLAVDENTMEVFYTEDDQAGGDTYHPLSKINVDGSGNETVIPKLLDPQGIGIDSAHKKIYYTEHHGQRVGVVDYDGKNQKVLHQFQGTDFPADVKVDAKNGKIFAMVGAASSTGNKIVSMNLDGTSFTELKTDIVRAYGLTLDTANQKIYFISGGHGGFIGNLTYDGKQEGTVLGGLDWPYMLDYDAKQDLLVFSTTGVGDGVIRTVTTSGLNVTQTLTLGFAPEGVAFGKVPLN